MIILAVSAVAKMLDRSPNPLAYGGSSFQERKSKLSPLRLLYLVTHENLGSPLLCMHRS